MTGNPIPPDGGTHPKPYLDRFPIRRCPDEKPRTYSHECFPLAHSVCKHPEPLDVKMDAEGWLEQPRFDFVKEILDADGWDRSNWVESWAEEITAEEMERRVSVSTVSYHYIPGMTKPIKNPCAEIHLTPKPIQYMDNLLGSDPRTPDGDALVELLGRLRQAWTADTSSIPIQWKPDNPAWGQCAVTAILVNCFVGGLIIRGLMNHGRTHYWNISKTGESFDLTREQFSELHIVDATVVDADSLLADDDFSYRYTKMLQNLAKVTIDAIPPSGGEPGHGDYSDVGEDGDINVEIVTPVMVDLLNALLQPGMNVEVSDSEGFLCDGVRWEGGGTQPIYAVRFDPEAGKKGE